MKTSSPILSLLLAAPYFSTLALSSPVANTNNNVRRSQIVLADVEDATRSNPTLRQGDLVDSMIAEAKSKGQDLSDWGIEDATREGKKELEGISGPFTESIDLFDEVARAKLIWEAALDNTVFTIQPISKKVKSVGDDVSSKVSDDVELALGSSTVGPPGSGWIWNVCGSGQEAAILHELDVSPDPPVAGKNLTVRAKGIVNAPIHEGTYADVVVKLGFIRLLARRFDICELARENNADVQCPVEPGEYELVQTAELPKEIPPAKFNVHVSGKTHEDIDFVCTDLSIDFMHH